MDDTLHAGMREATRLTRSGRLIEATALLQRLLQKGRDPNSAPNKEGGPPTIDLVPEAVAVTDRAPLSRNRPGRRANGVVRANFPEALRGFLDRIAPTRSEPQPDEIAEPSPEALEPPERGQFLMKSYSNQAGTRHYKLYVPSRYCGQPLPLIVMLHGCTQSPDDFAAGTRMNLRAEEHNCFVAYPAQPASANASKCWNWFRPG
ncbi:MAG TPA: PHB depolymerase family esterase, partial [Stellaceae bacterium]|nr:PHB depolymerase family esterase [Stellaceae bacterium]